MAQIHMASKNNIHEFKRVSLLKDIPLSASNNITQLIVDLNPKVETYNQLYINDFPQSEVQIIEKQVFIDKPIYIEKPIEIIKEIIKEVEVEKVIIQDRPVYIDVIKEMPVYKIVNRDIYKTPLWMQSLLILESLALIVMLLIK